MPAFLQQGAAEQAVNLLGGAGAAIIWFSVAAANAIVFFWVCEELIQLSPFQRTLALVLLVLLCYKLDASCRKPQGFVTG
jgi:hypothetical protein